MVETVINLATLTKPMNNTTDLGLLSHPDWSQVVKRVDRLGMNTKTTSLLVLQGSPTHLKSNKRNHALLYPQWRSDIQWPVLQCYNKGQIWNLSTMYRSTQHSHLVLVDNFQMDHVPIRVLSGVNMVDLQEWVHRMAARGFWPKPAAHFLWYSVQLVL